MESYQILKSIHKVGHSLTRKVIGYKEPIDHNGTCIGGQVILESNSEFNVILPFDYLFDDKMVFDKSLLPEIGHPIKVVIKNYVDDILYVSSRPSDLDEKEIQNYKQFYDFIEKNNEGKSVEGIVKKVMSFGIFVDIGSEFIGLIDIGHSSFNMGKKLPNDLSKWPKKGGKIKCVIAYYRFYNKQIGLGWTPA